MKKTNKTFYSFIISLFCVLLFSCSLNYNEEPPYCVSKLEVLLHEVASHDSSCLMVFNLKNTSDHEIKTISLHFSVYNSQTQAPITFKTINKIKLNNFISSNEEVEYQINLEPFISMIPNVHCIVDYFHITEIVFSNGKRWTDPLGIYIYTEN